MGAESRCYQPLRDRVSAKSGLPSSRVTGGREVDFLRREFYVAGHQRTPRANDHIEQDYVAGDASHLVGVVLENFDK